MRKATKTRWIGTVLAAALAWPFGVSGVELEPRQPRTAIAQVEVGPALVEWLPQVEHESLILTIAGPGDLYIQREFGSGETPVFSSLDVQGGNLPDGIYAYELRAVPRQAPKLREKPTGQLVQSGHLWVQEGSFVGKTPIQRDTSRQSKPESKPPLRNVAEKTTVPDDLVVKGHACVGPACTVVVPGDPGLTLKEDFGGQLQIKLQSTACCHPTAMSWAIQGNDMAALNGDFAVRNLTFNTIPFRISGGTATPDNSLTVFVNGNIGLGTLTPANSLHVLRTNGTAQLLVEEASPTAAQRTLTTLKNKGGIQLVMRDTSTAVDWVWQNVNGEARITDGGDAVNELVLNQNGNLTIAGTLTQSSDRASKRDILPVRPDEVLAKVLALPIATWNRKTDDPTVRHMGPMAQDFAAIFGLGEDDRHIATLDMAGVSLASIQALHGRVTEVVTEKDAEISELRRENADLAERLAALEALVSGIVEPPGE